MHVLKRVLSIFSSDRMKSFEQPTVRHANLFFSWCSSIFIFSVKRLQTFWTFSTLKVEIIFTFSLFALSLSLPLPRCFCRCSLVLDRTRSWIPAYGFSLQSQKNQRFPCWQLLPHWRIFIPQLLCPLACRTLTFLSSANLSARASRTPCSAPPRCLLQQGLLGTIRRRPVLCCIESDLSYIRNWHVYFYLFFFSFFWLSGHTLVSVSPSHPLRVLRKNFCGTRTTSRDKRGKQRGF